MDEEPISWPLEPGLPEDAELAKELAPVFGFAAPAARPAASTKLRLLAAIAPAVDSAIGLHVLRKAQVAWQATPFPGVSFKPLYLDPATQMQTLILKLEPNATYPRHRHGGVEQCLVLSGDVFTKGQDALAAGDFQWADSGSDHDEISSRNGCQLLLIASVHNQRIQ